MATKIVTKNSSTASAVPTTSDLVQGELAVNVADKRLFTEDNGGSIVELGTNPSTLNVDGTATMDGLDVNGTITAYGLNFDISDGVEINALESIVFDIDSDNNQSSRVFQVKANNSTPLFTIQEEGNVGIGTTSPSSALDVVGTASATSVTSAQHLTAGSAYSVLFGDGGERISGNNSSSLLNFFTGATERMRIDSSGNLLVGKTASNATTAGVELAPNGIGVFTYAGRPLYLNRLASDGNIIDVARQGTTVGSIGVVNSNNPYFTSASRGIRIAGNNIRPCSTGGANLDNTISLGDTGQRFKDLYLSGEVIAGAGANNNPSITSHVDTDTGLFFGGGNILGFSTGGSERMRIDTYGSLLVGCTSFPSASVKGLAIRANGTAGQYIQFGVSLTQAVTVQQFQNPNGVVGTIQTFGSSTSFNTSSDQRLKENIADADDAGSKIDAIQVRKYDWKADGSHQDYGMVAQELQLVAPEAVSGDADSEEMMGVDYSKLVPLMLKEIQSLRNRVAQLEE